MISASAAARRRALGGDGLGRSVDLAEAEPGLEFRAGHAHHDGGLHAGGGLGAVERVLTQVDEDVGAHLPGGSGVGGRVVSALLHRPPHPRVEHGADGCRVERCEPGREHHHAVRVVAHGNGAVLVLALLAAFPCGKVGERLRPPDEFAHLVQGQPGGLRQGLGEERRGCARCREGPRAPPRTPPHHPRRDAPRAPSPRGRAGTGPPGFAPRAAPPAASLATPRRSAPSVARSTGARKRESLGVGEKSAGDEEPIRLGDAPARRPRDQLPRRPKALPCGQPGPGVGRLRATVNLRGDLRHQHVRVAPQSPDVIREREELGRGEPRHVRAVARAHGRGGRHERVGAERHDSSQAATTDIGGRNVGFVEGDDADAGWGHLSARSVPRGFGAERLGVEGLGGSRRLAG